MLTLYDHPRMGNNKLSLINYQERVRLQTLINYYHEFTPRMGT